MVTPWFVWNVNNADIRIQIIFQDFWPQVQNNYFIEHVSMVVSNIVENNVSFFKKFWPRQKNLSKCMFIPFSKYQGMRFLLNKLLEALFNLIVRRVTEEEGYWGGRVGIYNKYFHRDCVNKWVSSIYKTKLSWVHHLFSCEKYVVSV